MACINFRLGISFVRPIGMGSISSQNMELENRNPSPVWCCIPQRLEYMYVISSQIKSILRSLSKKMWNLRRL